jgi:hypothetical protein
MGYGSNKLEIVLVQQGSGELIVLPGLLKPPVQALILL